MTFAGLARAEIVPEIVFAVGVVVADTLGGAAGVVGLVVAAVVVVGVVVAVVAKFGFSTNCSF